MAAQPVFYATARAVMAAAARVYFGGIAVRNRERVPRTGPLLVVANHPASFTDVVVLGTSIPRRLHFLAMAPIFRPWIRGFALRLGGALPVYRRQDDPTLMDRNDDTFRAVHEILGHGGAVLIFPEGTSRTDRSIVPVRTGAARIALGHMPGRAGPLTLLPVGLHFADRAAFGSEVVVSVGRPVELEPFQALAAADPPAAVRRLTDAIQVALERLIVHISDQERVALVHAVEQLYADHARAVTPRVPAIGIARGVAGCVDHLMRTDPERVLRAWRRVRAYQSRLAALQVHDRALREMLPREGRTGERLRLIGIGLLGLLPALAGGVVHYLPWKLSGVLGRRLAPDVTNVTALRIMFGMILFPALYAGLGLLLWRGFGLRPRTTLLALALLVPLGIHSRGYFDWLRHQRQRLRLIRLRMTHRRLVARVRRERRELIGLFDAAAAEYLAARTDGVAASATEAAPPPPMPGPVPAPDAPAIGPAAP